MDELSTNEGNFRQVHNKNVGHVFGESALLSFLFSRVHRLTPAFTLQIQQDRAEIQAEGADAFSQFHLYVCSALLVKYSERLREMDFQVRYHSSISHSLPEHCIDLAGDDNFPSVSADKCMERP